MLSLKSKYENFYHKPAFTLIELLVVIAIIGILSGLIVVSMNGSINSANDAKRKANIDAIRKALIVYGTLNRGVYPTGIPEAAGCNISSNGATTNRCVNLASALLELLPVLPIDPISGRYYTYISTGSDFTISSTLSSGRSYGYNSTSGSYSSIFARSSVHSSTNPIVYCTNVDDLANGALLGSVCNFSNAWYGQTTINLAHGFSLGTYDIYLRARTTGATNYLPAGIYDYTTTAYYSLSSMTGLTSTYQVKKIGSFTLTEAIKNNNICIYFNAGPAGTNYYIDYIEFRLVI